MLKIRKQQFQFKTSSSRTGCFISLRNRYSYGKGFGRKGIIKACEEIGCLITEHEVREILKFQKKNM